MYVISAVASLILLTLNLLSLILLTVCHVKKEGVPMFTTLRQMLQVTLYLNFKLSNQTP